MTYRGRVKDGVVVPESGAVLPEGTEVRIDVQSPAITDDSASNAGTQATADSMYERYRDIIGVLNDLPPDASERVDEHLYGTPDS
jgi:hypothetical protein